MPRISSLVVMRQDLNESLDAYERQDFQQAADYASDVINRWKHHYPTSSDNEAVSAHRHYREAELMLYKSLIALHKEDAVMRMACWWERRRIVKRMRLNANAGDEFLQRLLTIHKALIGKQSRNRVDDILQRAAKGFQD